MLDRHGPADPDPTRRPRIPVPLRKPTQRTVEARDEHPAFKRVCDALEAHERGSVPSRGPDRARALCPAHEDEKPSLNLTAFKGGVLVHCHAGCDIEEVLDAVGLTSTDLFDDPVGARYEYTDAGDRVTRIVTRTPGKTFSQEGDRGRAELFRLPAVHAARIYKEPVYLVEGEKDVLALETLGVTATTAPNGASSFHKVDAEPLRGATVVAVVDRDRAGDGWALQVTKKLHSVDAMVTFVRSASGNDSADHIAAGLGIDDFIAYEHPDQDLSSGDQDGDEPPASWAPVELGPYLDGSHKTLEPTLLRRTDGVCLLYPGLTHSLYGESESGKSMILQYEAATLIAGGQDVLWLDFESDPASVVARLRMMGATVEQIDTHFRYVHPDHPNHSVYERAAWEQLLTGPWSLVVIDGVTNALSLNAAQSLSNDDVATWMRAVPDRLARSTGAAVVMVDHVVKDGPSRGRFPIGAQAKISGLTGAAYTVAVDKPFGRGVTGQIILRVAKDRPGFVRGHCGPPRGDRTAEVARIVVESVGETISMTVNPWRGEKGSGTFRPTTLMERVSDLIGVEPMGFNLIASGVTGRSEHIRQALNVLVEEGFAELSPGAKNAHIYTQVRPYRERDDEQSDRYQRGTQLGGGTAP